jgi:CheY-like chemotaxis protein
VPRIAVINTAAGLRALMGDLCAAQGWDMVPCPDSTTAHELVEREHPDAIILDLWLENPEAGWIVLHRLRSNPATRDIPVVVCSNHREHAGERMSWLAEQQIPVLPKPFEVDDLYDVVGQALEQHLKKTEDGE